MPSLTDPGTTLILGIRDRRSGVSPLTGRGDYEYRVIERSERTGRPTSPFMLFHEADFIVGANGYVFKNRFGPHGGHWRYLPWGQGAAEIGYASLWYENGCKHPVRIGMI